MNHAVAHLPRLDIGLSLAGAVSCGAYIAGAVDFLVEALDKFAEARGCQNPQAPSHEAVICAISGASSGALTTAALVAALDRMFPPVRHGTAEEVASGNPLYDSWVNMTDATHLLGTRDRDAEPLQSLLDPTRLHDVTRKALTFGEGMQSSGIRSWLADPLRVSFTVTNLRGVPDLPSTSPAPGTLAMTTHADSMRFTVAGLGASKRVSSYPDEHQLDRIESRPDRWEAWRKQFAEAALASAAVPFALAPRTLCRPTSDYKHSSIGWPASFVDSSRIAPVAPDRSAPGPASQGSYQFAAVDGGLTNNSPFDLALAGLRRARLAHDTLVDPGRGKASKWAVLMIDPLVANSFAGPSSAAGLSLQVIATSLAKILLAEARFRPDEIARALDEKVYNRFLLTPGVDESRRQAGGCRLAGDFLAGFGGYLSREFRRHDYLLGRCDAQHYLARVLTLPSEHPLFARWTDDQREHYRVRTTGELPIIPLIDELHPSRRREPVPDWPLGRANLARLAPSLDARLDFLCRRLPPRMPLNLLAWPPLRWLAVRWARKRILRIWQEALQGRGLA